MALAIGGYGTAMYHRVGVLGGLGPGATLEFIAEVMAWTPAYRDQDHIAMLVDHNPAVPQRQAGPDHDEAAIRAALRAMATGLEAAGATFLVMPCNTAHAFVDEALAAISVPFLSIVEATLAELAELPATQIGVLATDACIGSALYHDALRERGLQAVDLGSDSQKRLMDTIFAIKAGVVGASSSSARNMQALAEELVDAGAQALLIACTEIPMVLKEATVPMVNSTQALARATVQRVKGRAVGRN